MAHNNRTRASLAAWNSGVVTPAEFNKLDTQAFESINGDQGGVWAPATVIELGGAGLLVSGPFEATGTSDLDATDFHGDVNILTGNNFQARGDVFLGNDSGDAVTVEGTSAFNAPATFNYALTVNSSAVFNDNAQFNDTVAFIGLAVFADDVNFAEPVNFEDNVTFEDPVDFDDDVDFAVGTTVTIRGDAHIGTDAGDDVLVGGTATFDAPVTFTDDVSIF